MNVTQWPRRGDTLVDRVLALAARIDYPQRPAVLRLQRENLTARWYLQLQVARDDAITGDPGVGRSGKAYLSTHMTDSEIVQTIFGLIKGYEEHECREYFRLDGVAIFGPHIDYQALLVAARQTDARRPIPSTQGA